MNIEIEPGGDRKSMDYLTDEVATAWLIMKLKLTG